MSVSATLLSATWDFGVPIFGSGLLRMCILFLGDLSGLQFQAQDHVFKAFMDFHIQVVASYSWVLLLVLCFP